MSNHLDVFCNYLLLTSSAPDISTEVVNSFGFSFAKKLLYTPLNTVPARIFLREGMEN